MTRNTARNAKIPGQKAEFLAVCQVVVKYQSTNAGSCRPQKKNAKYPAGWNKALAGSFEGNEGWVNNAPVLLLFMAAPTFRINGRPNRLPRQPARHSLRCCEIAKIYSIYAYCGSNVPRRGRKGTGSTSSRWPKSNSSDQGSKARMNRSSGGTVRSLRSRRRQTRRQIRQWTKARSVRPSVL